MIKTPSSSKVSKQAQMVGWAIPGAMLSKVGAGYVPGGKYGKLGLAIVAAVGAAAITGSSTGANAARGALAGAAIHQSVEAMTEFIQPIAAKFVSEGEPSKLKELVSKATGLSAGYPTNYEPGYYVEQPPEQEALGNPIPAPTAAQWGVG